MASGWLSRMVESKVGRGRGGALLWKGRGWSPMQGLDKIYMDTNHNTSSSFQTLKDKEVRVLLHQFRPEGGGGAGLDNVLAWRSLKWV
jgi:hypothetical protein